MCRPFGTRFMRFYPTRHYRAGLQAVPSLRDCFCCGLCPGLFARCILNRLRKTEFSAACDVVPLHLQSSPNKQPDTRAREYVSCETWIAAILSYARQQI